MVNKKYKSIQAKRAVTRGYLKDSANPSWPKNYKQC